LLFNIYLFIDIFFVIELKPGKYGY